MDDCVHPLQVEAEGTFVPESNCCRVPDIPYAMRLIPVPPHGRPLTVTVMTSEDRIEEGNARASLKHSKPDRLDHDSPAVSLTASVSPDDMSV